MTERELFEQAIRENLSPDHVDAALAMEGDYYAEYGTVLAWAIWRESRRTSPASSVAPLTRVAATVPEGWKLVPSKATPEMRAAFKLAYGQGSIWTDRIDHAIDALLTATPAAESKTLPRESEQ